MSRCEYDVSGNASMCEDDRSRVCVAVDATVALMKVAIPKKKHATAPIVVTTVALAAWGVKERNGAKLQAT